MPSVSLIGYNTPSFSALVDSGSSNCFIDTTFVNENSLHPYSIPPLQLHLFNRTTNSTITQVIDLSIHFSTSDITPMTFYVTSLDGSCSLVLGHNWLTLHNPLIDWISSSISFCALEQTMPATPSSPLQPLDLPPLADTTPSDIHHFSDCKPDHIMIISAPAFALACHLKGSTQFSLQLQPKETTLHSTSTTSEPADLSRVPQNTMTSQMSSARARLHSLLPIMNMI